MKKVFMKKPFPKMILRILLVCVLLLGFLYMDDDIGTSAANLESDIRNLQKIPEDWIVEGDVSDTMAASIPKIGAIILFLST